MTVAGGITISLLLLPWPTTVLFTWLGGSVFERTKAELSLFVDYCCIQDYYDTRHPHHYSPKAAMLIFCGTAMWAMG